MKITIEVAKLIDMLDMAGRFVAKNATLPILQNVYMKATIDTLIMRATDMEKYVEIEKACNVGTEGAITINAKTITDLIKTIEDKEVEISVDQNTNVLTLKTQKDTFDINGIAASEYVALPEVPEENTIDVDAHAFAAGIERVEYAVTEKNFSPVLTGVLLRSKEEGGNNQLTFVGTDSFRLSEYKTGTVQGDNEFSLIIPKVTINDIKRIADYALEHETDHMKMKYSDNLVAFSVTIGDMKILATSLLIQGNFPDYDREDIMPKNFNTTVLVDKNLCEKAIKKIAILTRDINNFIQIETNKDQITISSGKTDKGAGTTSLPAVVDGDDVTFGVNGRYITDFIRIMQGDEVQFHVVDSQKPLILMDKTDNNYKYVVRPLINN